MKLLNFLLSLQEFGSQQNIGKIDLTILIYKNESKTGFGLLCMDMQILKYKRKIILRIHSNVFTLESNNIITINPKF